MQNKPKASERNEIINIRAETSEKEKRKQQGKITFKRWLFQAINETNYTSSQTGKKNK